MIISQSQVSRGIGVPTPVPIPPPSGDVLEFSLSLSTAGRLGFFIDYSELATSGTHTFYVCRTHGTTGAVSVDYTTGGDTHDTVSGTFSWADGEANIKSFTAVVTPAQLSAHEDGSTAGGTGLGDHRMWALLSNPTGGGVLHFGSTHTRAYGVIDTGAIASDSNAVFFDMAAVTNGTGTRANPYNIPYNPILNVGAKRYIYGTGNVVPDGTNSGNISGSGPVNFITPPATRSGEDTRVYIQQWPGQPQLTIDGGGSTDTLGFYTNSGQSYCTYRGINFSNLDTTSATFAELGSTMYLYGASAGINVEFCDTDGINGSTNTSPYALWGVIGAKVWRCLGANVTVNGSASLNGAGIMETYDGQNISVQRCESDASNEAGVYHKRVETLGDVSTAVRFCKFDDSFVYYSQSGGGDPGHSYTITQGNLFKNITSFTADGIGHNTSNVSELGNKAWWCMNVFDTCGIGENSPIYFQRVNNTQIFNNLFKDCAGAWRDYTNQTGADIEYADYNGMDNVGTPYEVKAVNYASQAALTAANPFNGVDLGVNDSFGTITFTNPATDDYTLNGSAVGEAEGVSGTDMGIYPNIALQSIITIGAED